MKLRKLLSLTHNFGKEFTICTRWTIFYFLFLIALGDIVLDEKCPEPNGMFPDPKNCSSFYHCDDGVAYHKACSPPLMFNPEKNTCDWPDNVKCGKRKNLSTPLLLFLYHLLRICMCKLQNPAWTYGYLKLFYSH